MSTVQSERQKVFRNNLITYALVIAAYLCAEAFLLSGHMTSLMKGLLVPLCTYSIMAVSLNLVVGISGELSLGHAGFMCVGAFASATWSMLMKGGSMPNGVIFLIAILIGASFAALSGFLIGIPVLRLKGDYLAIVTLAFGEIIKNIINALYFGIDENGLHFSLKDTMAMGLSPEGTVIIKGAQGITGTPKLSTFTMGTILLLLSLFIVLNMVNSRTGRAIMAIRDNRIAAESIGLNPARYKLLAFTVSAAIAGVGGVLYAHNLSSLQALPKNFGYNQSIMILVFVVLGGIGNIRGSVIAAVILTLLPELLRFMNDYRMLIYAVVLILMMLFTSAPSWKAARESLLLRLPFRRKEGQENEAQPIQESKAPDGSAGSAAQPETAADQKSESEGMVQGGNSSGNISGNPAENYSANTAGNSSGNNSGDSSGNPAAEGRRSMLETDALSISFGGLKAVDNFSVSIEKKELYGLIGPNGAGKTTVFNILTGVYKPDSGRILLDGEPVTALSCEDISRKGIARTFQNIRLFSALSVLDNVKAGLHNHYVYSTLDGILRTKKFRRMEQAMDRKAMELLRVFELDGCATWRASNLPYGQQRKLEIARALATGPKLLLLDEPAAGMNPNETEELMDTIRMLRDRFDMTILLIEHDMKLVSGICDRLTVLNFGQVLKQGNTGDVMHDPEVVKAYLGD